MVNHVIIGNAAAPSQLIRNFLFSFPAGGVPLQHERQRDAIGRQTNELSTCVYVQHCRRPLSASLSQSADRGKQILTKETDATERVRQGRGLDQTICKPARDSNKKEGKPSSRARLL